MFMMEHMLPRAVTETRNESVSTFFQQMEAETEQRVIVVDEQWQRQFTDRLKRFSLTELGQFYGKQYLSENV